MCRLRTEANPMVYLNTLRSAHPTCSLILSTHISEARTYHYTTYTTQPRQTILQSHHRFQAHIMTRPTSTTSLRNLHSATGAGLHHATTLPNQRCQVLCTRCGIIRPTFPCGHRLSHMQFPDHRTVENHRDPTHRTILLPCSLRNIYACNE